ncbi:MAG: N-acetylmuramoyl-L-alanine amidase, partial [Candidatus Omnitrophica bacterium]|nr:N-acetylmuramoyl-L-alanine amidase [Candidatus Omnitrophota bacterium]
MNRSIHNRVAFCISILVLFLFTTSNRCQGASFSSMSVETDPGWDRVRIILDCDSEPSFGSARFEYFSNPARVRITLPGYLKGLNEGRTTVTDSFLKTVVVDKISRNQFQVTAYLASPVDRAEVDFYSSSRMEFAYIDIPRPARYRQPWWTFSEVKRAKDSGIPVVVIDPGHGGYDPGAICRFNKSLHEKEVALDIGREVARTLKRNGVVYPVLTRSGDYYPTLDERVELIKNTAADLFVSVHADSAPDSRTANGFAVWTLDRTKNNFRARANQTSKYGWQNALDRFPPSQQAVMMKKQSNFVEHETEVAAKIMTTAMDRIPNLENRGFKPHDYNLVVLRHDYAPSFLVEAGFLSNSGDSQKLNSHSFRKRIGQEIARGIEAYFAQRSLAHRNAPIRPRITVASFTEDPTPRFTGQTFEYRVRRNETLKGLAQRFDVTVDEILIASGKPLSKTIIYVDEVLRIPTHPSQTSITPPSIRSQRTR